MIDQDLINKCESDIEDFGSLMKCQAQELLKNYVSLIEQNAELHKELVKSKSDYSRLYEICINSGLSKHVINIHMSLSNGQA